MEVSNTSANAIFGLVNGTHSFSGQEFHSITVGDVVWFRAKDIGLILGYADTARAVTQHVHSKNTTTLSLLLAGRQITGSVVFTQNQLQSKYINEPGIYALVFRSRLPLAQEFQQYVWDEVLPAIRKQAQVRSSAEVERLRQGYHQHTWLHELD